MEAKREEEGMMMMMRMVADADVTETEVAETAEVTVASEVEYSSPVPVDGSRWFQCAVCCAPTTMRCSRCKAVRYWSVLFLPVYVFELLCCVININ